MKEGYLDFDEYCHKKNRLSVFEKYINSDDPQIRQKASDWGTAIGLQAVDGLTVSNYLIELACKNIEGEITSKEVDDLLDKYYEEKRNRKAIWKEYETYTRIDVHLDSEAAKMGRPI